MVSYVTNKDLADTLFNVAELLEIDEANRFRVSAYRNAALTVLNAGEPLAIKLDRGEDLSCLPNIGEELSAAIVEILRTGELSILEELEQTLPPQLVELSHIPGLGAKRVKIIRQYYQPLTADILKLAAKRGDLARLPGIGPKTQEAIKVHYAD